MFKITRLLFLFSKLINGEKVNKTVFCFEHDCSPRTFDRDIQEIRLFLSESFSPFELKYNHSTNTYFMDGSKRELLEPMEYLLIERILKDSKILRKDEFEILLDHLLHNTDKMNTLDVRKKELCNKYQSPFHNKALLKMHGDLVKVIRSKQCINIHYFKSNGDDVRYKIIPCDIKFDLGYLYLIAYQVENNNEYPAYYRLDRIDSFEILDKQNIKEQSYVEKYLNNYSNCIIQMYGGDFVEIRLKCSNSFYPYVYDKFKNSKIISQDESNTVVKIKTFEDGFIKWLVYQSPELITVLYPKNTITKIVQVTKSILNKYIGVDNNEKTKISVENG